MAKIVKIQKSLLTTGVTVYYQQGEKRWSVTYLNPPAHLQLKSNC